MCSSTKKRIGSMGRKRFGSRKNWTRMKNGSSRPNSCWRHCAIRAGTLTPMNRFSYRTLLGALIVFATPLAFAEDTLQNYDVELVIFRVTRPNATAEDWALEQSQGFLTAEAGDSEEAPITVTTPATPGGGESAPASTEPEFPPLAAAQF